MRKKDDTLYNTLLTHARNIADSKGIESVNIRTIAQLAGVATGTVYNYFSSKDDILLALTEEYWRQALIEIKSEISSDTFLGNLEEIFISLREKIDCSAGILMGSLSNVETAGQQRMADMQTYLENDLLKIMNGDMKIRSDVWNESFTKEEFIRFTTMNMIMLLRAKAGNIDFLTEIIKRTIY